MRIIAGSQRGRRLHTPPPTPKGQPELIRPTADRAREALFSILGGQVKEARVADLFAGTGALGLEALSRGAASAVFVELRRPALALIADNIALCGFADRSQLVERDLRQGLSFLCSQPPFDLLFLDPPYGQELAVAMLTEVDRHRLLADEGMVVVEEQAGSQLPAAIGELVLCDQRRYGAAGFWFYRKGVDNGRL